MENKAHALVAGAFVLAVTALLALLAVWLTRDNTQRDLYEMSTSETISGLQPQAPVRFRGVPVGKVERIGFDDKVKGNVLIRVSIDRAAPVTKSVYATVASQGVTGLGFIQLDDDGESTERLVPNDDDPPRIPLKPGGLDKLIKQSEVIFNQVEQASTKLNQLLGDDTQKRVAAALDNVSQAAQGVNQLTSSMNTVINAQFGPDRVNFPAFVKNADATVTSLRRTSEQAERSVAEIGTAARRLNEKGGALDKLTEGGAALSAGVQTFSAATLPKLGEVADETARTMRQLRRTVHAVDDNPQALIFGNGPVAPGPGEAGFSANGDKK
ncbi:MAG: mammalian cell entry protein [Polaromonas sp. 24-62-144]|jgi:phospholipid/cholesterol/gamma-HCH transport system substrate-binding protein|uniref:MlaD family protein n=1 Tax=Polaromonas sp. TaxID=1869339 RepID=UPI000BC4AFBE|nr:MlaD family protein [Polaromonas sp.]OYY53343.1 MAG: mammalian cell entry protein [Polaromonas sp. 35-63-240]OYZ84261.1 MAG: mammalian cell entry protein [Polaromonas sp. 24-62-144]HQS31135.1 MlaD family protein [Polaromonas sp.]HQS90737.1 MlaD family protein [Polaromonas sp.]